MDIKFNSRTPEFSWLSNFSPHTVGFQPTAEHAYQASKYLDPVSIEGISVQRSPAAAKKWAEQHLDGRRPDWHERREPIMRAVLQRKFMDHPELKWALIGTYPHRLVHLAPWDTYWGENEKGVGLNKMGEILMELRDELRADYT